MIEETVTASWDTVEEDEQGEVYHEPIADSLGIPMVMCQSCGGIGAQEALNQPHIYQVLYPDSSYTAVRGARYTTLENGTLIICAKVTPQDNEPEYIEIANFPAGMWKGVAIGNYLV